MPDRLGRMECEHAITADDAGRIADGLETAADDPGCTEVDVATAVDRVGRTKPGPATAADDPGAARMMLIHGQMIENDR
jgi:hypothetical protein